MYMCIYMCIYIYNNNNNNDDSKNNKNNDNIEHHNTYRAPQHICITTPVLAWHCHKFNIPWVQDDHVYANKRNQREQSRQLSIAVRAPNPLERPILRL